MSVVFWWSSPSFVVLEYQIGDEQRFELQRSELGASDIKWRQE